MTRAFVLGSGGTRGGSWEVGALLALRAAGRDIANADLVIGTSAGSLLAAMVTLGIDLDTISRHQRRAPAAGDPLLPLDYDEVSAAAAHLGSRPLRPGEPGLLLASLAHRTPERWLPALAAVLPRGKADAHLIGRAVRAAMPAAGTWPANLRVVILDASTGRRRCLGPDDGVPLDEAVSASCAVPGIFAPVPVEGHRWYDGGFASADSADFALALPDGNRPEEVVVLSPVTVLGGGWPAGLESWLERRARRSLARQLERELSSLRQSGVRVELFRPDRVSLQVLGNDLMLAGDLGPVLDLARAQVTAEIEVAEASGPYATSRRVESALRAA